MKIIGSIATRKAEQVYSTDKGEGNLSYAYYRGYLQAQIDLKNLIEGMRNNKENARHILLQIMKEFNISDEE